MRTLSALQLISVLLGLVWACAGQVAAQNKTPAKPLPSEVEVRREVARLKADITKLESPNDAPEAWKELYAIKKELADLEREHDRKAAAVRKRHEEVAEAAEASARQKKIDDLERRLEKLQEVERKFNRVVGLRLFQARHAELAKRAVTKTSALDALHFDVLSFPRLDGSTSTQPLAVLIACRCSHAPYGWTGTEQRLPDHEAEIERFFGAPEPEAALLEFTLQARTDSLKTHRLGAIINGLLATNASTNQAYVNIVEGRSDVGLLARPPSEEELKVARARGVELDVRPCALDAFVFIVNSSNRVASLTTAQLQDIYAGKIKSWKQVGGRAGSITAYQREESSGSQQLMRNLVMKDVPFEVPMERFQGTPDLIGYMMSSPFLELTDNENGIGYSVYNYERYMSGSPRTRTIPVDGVEPSAETIAARKYPYVSEVLVVTRKGDQPDSPAIKMRDWLLSPEGQSIVHESGYVPLPTTSNGSTKH
jgi:phosphate transport system substrate-binding protein